MLSPGMLARLDRWAHARHLTRSTAAMVMVETGLDDDDAGKEADHR